MNRAVHELKCHPHFFAAIKSGAKPFEIRRNDRRYHQGDVLCIRKFDPSYGLIPGEEPLWFIVTYVMTDEDFPGILPGFVIMGIKPWTPQLNSEDQAKPIGEVVAKLPLTSELEQCNEYRKVAGLVMPRTCAKCGLGPCPYPKGEADEVGK